MKLTCTQQALSKGLSVVGHAVPSRPVLPVLSHVRLSTEQGRLSLSASNLEMAITCWLDAEIEEDGAITLPSCVLTDFIDSLPPTSVTITVPAGSCTATLDGTRSMAQIKGADPSAFPVRISTEDSMPPLFFETALLKELTHQVACCAADETARPILGAVLLRTEAERIIGAATDSFRLAVRMAPLPRADRDGEDILIPAKALTTFSRLLPTVGEVAMSVSRERSQVVLRTAGLELASRLIEGTFPRFEAILPTAVTTRVVLPTKEARAALKAVTPFARSCGCHVRLTVSGGTTSSESGMLHVEATSEELGETRSTLAATVEGPGLTMLFGARHLSEVAAVIDTPEVALAFTTPTQPCVVTPVGSMDARYLIMPMQPKQQEGA